MLITNDKKANLSVMVNDVEFRSQKLEFTTDLKIKLAGENMCLDIFPNCFSTTSSKLKLDTVTTTISSVFDFDEEKKTDFSVTNMFSSTYR